MITARRLLVASGLAALMLVFLLWWKPESQRTRPAKSPLVIYCAAGLKPPVEATARAYERAYGTPIQIQYGGSGTLVSNLRVVGRGDLFVAADESYLRMARTNDLLAEIIPLARMAPVIAVRKGNPKRIRSIDDLLRVEVALANPEAAAIGSVVREHLRKSGQWDALEQRVRVFKPTVTDIANDIKLGTVDAGIVWDATVNQYPELEMVRIPAWSAGGSNVSVGVLRCSQQPTAALHFARYLGAPDKGLKQFSRFGYQPVEGDDWAERPEAVLFSGGVNRLAIEETIQRFEQREGARVTRVYNGCGILVSQMKAGQHPDAYFACDVSFMPPVSDLFLDPLNVSETDIVLLVAKGNPLAIRTLEDLGRPGLRVGTANPEQSTLGVLTDQLLKELGLLEQVMANVKVQTPTADLLVNQMRTGSLDAVVVYEVSTSQVRDSLTAVLIQHPAAKAIQPYAVGKNSKHRLLMERLLGAICSRESRRRYESLGFRWRADAN
jgi:molybdate transport system substrate-binding protein